MSTVDHGDLPEVPEARATGGSTTTIEDVTEALKDVVDPELGINVVDLGLVYGVHVDDENVVTLDMTLTSAALPAAARSSASQAGVCSVVMPSPPGSRPHRHPRAPRRP